MPVGEEPGEPLTGGVEPGPCLGGFASQSLEFLHGPPM
jgi:hypothetical protein